MKGGAGYRLKYTSPIYMDDMAGDFPDLATLKRRIIRRRARKPLEMVGADGRIQTANHLITNPLFEIQITP